MDPILAWTNWAVGVLDGIKAPISGTNIASLWNWSNKESGSDVMRWNNPLNTTLGWAGAVNENSVGVKAYPSVQDGIGATVATLLNGRYPTIVANLCNQRPHQDWQNVGNELDVWGTGTNWLSWDLPAPGVKGEENDMAGKLIVAKNGPKQGQVFLMEGRSAAYIADPAVLGELTALLGPASEISDVTLEFLLAGNAAATAGPLNISLSGTLSGGFTGKAA